LTDEFVINYRRNRLVINYRRRRWRLVINYRRNPMTQLFEALADDGDRPELLIVAAAKSLGMSAFADYQPGARPALPSLVFESTGAREKSPPSAAELLWSRISIYSCGRNRITK